MVEEEIKLNPTQVISLVDGADAEAILSKFNGGKRAIAEELLKRKSRAEALEYFLIENPKAVADIKNFKYQTVYIVWKRLVAMEGVVVSVVNKPRIKHAKPAEIIAANKQ